MPAARFDLVALGAQSSSVAQLPRCHGVPTCDDAVAASNAVIVDATAWGRPRNDGQPPPFLDVIQQAVIGGEQLFFPNAPNSPRS